MNRPILSAISLFLSVILGVLFTLPKYQALKADRLKIEKEKTEIQQLEIYFSKIEKTSQELKSYTEALSKIESALPGEPSFPSLFNFLYKVSSQSGVVLNEISVPTTSSLKEKPYIKEHSIILSLSGSYSSFKNFLSVLEKSARFINTEAISFSPSSAEPEKEGLFNFNLKIKVYSY